MTAEVLKVQGHESEEHFRGLHARLFPVGWPGLRNLHDGWRARLFKPLTFAERFPGGIVGHDEDGRLTVVDAPAGGLPAGVQLGLMLGWALPVYKRNDGSLEGSLADSEANAALVDGCRERCVGSKGNAYQPWHNRAVRARRAVRELEQRIAAEGVRVEWAEEPVAEPSFGPLSG